MLNKHTYYFFKDSTNILLNKGAIDVYGYPQKLLNKIEFSFLTVVTDFTI